MTRTIAKPALRLGFFTRLLDQADAAERYRLATAQIIHAERCGFDSAWVAQHHFHEDEGGLPAPFVFLSQVAARTTRIRLGTGIVTLPLELPVRVAEDAAVLDLMCGGRLEVGIGPGGNLSAYDAFGLDSTERTALLVRHHRILVDAWSGRALPGGDRLYPPNPGLADRIWQATFNIEGARRAGAAGWKTPTPTLTRRAVEQGTPELGLLLGCLINDLVGTGKDRRRDGKAEQSSGIAIDGQPKLTGRLDRQIGGMRALEDLVDVTRRAAEQVAVISGERDQSPFDGKDSEGVDHGTPRLRGEFNNPGALNGAQRAGGHIDALGAIDV